MGKIVVKKGNDIYFDNGYFTVESFTEKCVCGTFWEYVEDDALCPREKRFAKKTIANHLKDEDDSVVEFEA